MPWEKINEEVISLDAERVSHTFPNGRSDELEVIEVQEDSSGFTYDSGTLPDYDEYLFRITFKNDTGSGSVDVRVNNNSTTNYAYWQGGSSATTGDDSFPLSMENKTPVRGVWTGWLQ